MLVHSAPTDVCRNPKRPLCRGFEPQHNGLFFDYVLSPAIRTSDGPGLQDDAYLLYTSFRLSR